MYHRISPGCTTFIHLHPAKKWAIAKRTLSVHFSIVVTGPNSSLQKKKSLWDPGIKDSEDLHPLS